MRIELALDCPAREFIRSLNCDISTGPWVAGGAARALIDGHSPADIDIFFRSQEQSTQFIRDLERKGVKSRAMNSRLPYYKVPYVTKGDNRIDGIFDCLHAASEYSVQPVFVYQFNSVNNLFDDFDITASLFATDGYVVVGPDQAWIDLKEKRLALNTVPASKFRKTGSRLGKYAGYGLTPQPGVVVTVLKEALTEKRFSMNRKRMNTDESY